MRVLLEAEIDPCSSDISSELAGPGFEATVLRIEVSENIFHLQIQFECEALGPLVQQDSATRTVLDVTQCFDVVFSTDTSPYRFTGKPVSQTTGFYYYGARWYDPSVGRFISVDPYPADLESPQTLNPYSYVVNSPTNGVDPWGQVSDYCKFTDCCESDNLGGCIDSALDSATKWYAGLSPEEKDVINIGVLVAATYATGGLDLLVVGGVGFAAGYNSYIGYNYATGGTPTLSGALEWGTIGFVAALIAYGGYQLASGFLGGSSSDLSDAELLNIKTIGPGHLPETAEEGGIPNSIMRNFDQTGLHTVGFYDENGSMIVRVDVTGPPHADVPTPHVVDYLPNPRPGGGYGFKKTFWGPTDRGFDQLIAWIGEIED